MCDTGSMRSRRGSGGVGGVTVCVAVCVSVSVSHQERDWKGDWREGGTGIGGEGEGVTGIWESIEQYATRWEQEEG